MTLLKKIVAVKTIREERVLSHQEWTYKDGGRRTKRTVEVEEFPVYVLECGHSIKVRDLSSHTHPDKEKRKRIQCSVCAYGPHFEFAEQKEPTEEDDQPLLEKLREFKDMLGRSSIKMN